MVFDGMIVCCLTLTQFSSSFAIKLWESHPVPGTDAKFMAVKFYR
jgi:hypothetical protein